MSITVKNVEDRRVRRTKSLIRNAFLTLLAKKRFDQITVTDIIQEADYNRATFYRHYHDKEDLVNQIIKRQINLLVESIIQPFEDKGIIDFTELEPNDIMLFDHIIEEKDFYELWDKLKEIPDFQINYVRLLREAYNNKVVLLSSSEEEVNIIFHTLFFAYGIAGILFNWIENGCKETPSYMAEQLAIILRTPPKKSVLQTNKSDDEKYQ